jgi:hypothetical protein
MKPYTGTNVSEELAVCTFHHNSLYFYRIFSKPEKQVPQFVKKYIVLPS